MSIRMFEFYHGSVIAKLVRSDKPITLRMIETQPDEKWSTYGLNDAVDLFITYSKNPRNGKKGTSWTFPFSENQLQQIHSSTQSHIALICSQSDSSDFETAVCLLNGGN